MHGMVRLRVWFLFVLLEAVVFVSAVGVGARSFQEKTFTHEGSEILVKYLGDVEVVSVKPYIKARKGKKEGRLLFDVVIKNTGTEARAYNVFGEGKAEDGIWLYGGLRKPAQVQPGEMKTVQIATEFDGEALPKEMRVQVLQDFSDSSR